MPTAAAGRAAATVALLVCSNAFMTSAWYLHLKIKSWPMTTAIFLSWMIAFFEYCLQVPANRLGHFSQGGPFTAPQLKIIQESISLTAFAIFSVLVLKERLRWSDAASFALIFAGVAVGLFSRPAIDPHHAIQAEMKAAVAPLDPAHHPHPHPQQGGGHRRLLELLPLGGSARVGGQQQQQQHSHQQQLRERHSNYQSLGGGEQHEDSGDELRAMASSSAVVLIAGDAQVHASSSQQHEVQRREHTLREAEAEYGGGGASGEAD